jgi:hypothetical protein
MVVTDDVVAIMIHIIDNTRCYRRIFYGGGITVSICFCITICIYMVIPANVGTINVAVSIALASDVAVASVDCSRH